MKILKIEDCMKCGYFNFVHGINGKVARFKCYNPDTIRKNGNYRIINRKLALWGKSPIWCGLENYKEEVKNDK